MASENPNGRPTKYRPEYDAQIIGFGKLGYHVDEMATAFDVALSSLYVWAEAYPNFSEAFTRAKCASRGFYFKKLRDGMDARDFNPKTVEVMMKFGLKISENREVRVPGLKKAKTFSDKAKVVIDAVADGKITTREAKDICETIAIGAKVEEVDSLKAKLEEVEALIKNGLTDNV